MIKLALAACVILCTMAMSAWCHLSSRVSRPSSADLSSRVFPDRPDTILTASVGIWDIYPGSCFYPSRIPHPESKNRNEREGRKKFFVIPFFVATNFFHKIVNYFIFEMLKKKIWANFQRIIELFTQTIVTKLSKIWVWDPVTDIRDPEKTYSGSPGQKGTRSLIRNTAYCWIFSRQDLSASVHGAQACVANSRCGRTILLVQPDENMPIPIVESSCRLAQHRLGCPGCLGTQCRWFEVVCHH